MSVIDRFLRYVEFETTSNENSESIPSTEKQTVLADYLVKELKSIGVSDAYRDNTVMFTDIYLLQKDLRSIPKSDQFLIWTHPPMSAEKTSKQK